MSEDVSPARAGVAMGIPSLCYGTGDCPQNDLSGFVLLVFRKILVLTSSSPPMAHCDVGIPDGNTLLVPSELHSRQWGLCCPLWCDIAVL